MIKITLLIVTVLMLIFTIFLFYNYNQAPLTGSVIIDQRTYTKAQCDEKNLCQDYIVTCKNKEVISISPITGASIQFPKEWIDPRTELEKEISC